MDYDGIKAISKLIHHNHGLARLNISKHRSKYRFQRHYGSGRERAGCRVEGEFRVKGAAYVCVLCEGVGSCGISGKDGIAEGISENHGLTVLNLSDNNIGRTGIEAIARAIEENSTMVSLSLMQNNIGDDEIKVLAKAIKTHPCLVKLKLGMIKVDSKDLLDKVTEDKRIIF
eukprot:TRINITY_DN1735_c0_g1_i5.p1 TRINITY_DN1735_c0_g1~~TRINITY_DN1735_c0_g1_i5.p1  ORF type:complete len:172 (-),score=21.19 TRINITY_DN1735_c0_g1_i5:152-667(-)